MWQRLLWDLLLPLLRNAHHLSEVSSSEVTGGEEIGRAANGRAIVMLTHHSRNTEQKQWDETQVGGAA